MSIYIDDEHLIFHLKSKKTSYIMQVTKGEYLSHLYWGKGIQTYRSSNQIIYIDRVFSPNPDRSDRTFSLDTLPQEYPAYGNGDFRVPSYQIQQENGSTITDLRYKEHRTYKGKPKLKGLPSTYVEKDTEAETLEVVMEDKLLGLIVTLTYSLYEDRDVITRSVQFENRGSQKMKLLRALSASVDFRDDEYELMTLYGAAQNEKNIARRKVLSGIQMIESCRGASSPQQAPFMALVRKETNEDHGDVYAFNLVYSGNFTAQVQVDPYRTTRVSIGLNPFDFSWLLEPSETFQTPEVVMVYTASGLGDMSRIYHELYSQRLCRGEYRDALRPILINNWEATYFDFTADQIEEIATEAKEVGIELFVLDDGWFGERNDSKSSLGDWVVNSQKLPKGLLDLANRVCNLGMEFGIWFEPEMVSMNSDLYRNHPDWCLHVPDRPHTFGRNQLVLDLSRQEVCDYLIQALTDILSSAPITYVKWDMNRHMTDIGSSALEPERQRETAHRYMLGLYKIMEEITAAFPNVLFESCSSGGGRFDAGMLHYMPQTWTSDNTDAISRLKIQYGTSLVYPPITMGAHVSSVPNHQVGRITPLDTRGYVAMAGNFGYELDLTKLTEHEKESVKQQIALYKEIRPLIQFGRFHRIVSPFNGNEAAWSFVSRDQTEVVLSYFTILSQPAAPVQTVKYKGLNPDFIYKNIETGELFGGDELMYVGITFPRKKQDFTSQFWRFKKHE